MANVSKTTTIQAAPDAVWETVRDFGGIHTYVEAITDATTEGTGIGTMRTLTMRDGAQITERLDHRDDQARELRYSIVQSPLPLEDYVSTARVQAKGPGVCEITWSSTFEPKGAPEAEVVELIEGLYAMGFKGLKTLHGAPASSG